MIDILIGILAGFGLGLFINSEWFKNSVNKLIGKIFQRNSTKLLLADDTLESFYRQLYKESQMQKYSLINYILIYSIIILFIMGIAVMLLNLLMPSVKIGSFVIPSWVLLAIGDILAIIFKQIIAKRKNAIKVTYLDSLQEK